jgi:putative transposase
MAATSMSLDELVRKLLGDEHADVLRETLAWFVGELMEAEVTQRVGAGPHERSPERVTQRNGYRERLWQTRAGELTLAIPRLRSGSYFPSFLEPRSRSEKALVAVIQEAYVNGVSTRKVERLVTQLGLSGMSRSAVSRLCAGLDEQVRFFRERPLEGQYPYLWLDAKVEEGQRAGWRPEQGARDRLRRAPKRSPRDHRHRRRRSRDRGLLEGVPPELARPWPLWCAALRLRCP